MDLQRGKQGGTAGHGKGRAVSRAAIKLPDCSFVIGWISELPSALSQLDWGSVADWASGIGSIVAAMTALHLAGAERRARTLADRPHANVHISECDSDEWVSVELKIENRSRLHWCMTAIEAVKPKDTKLVHPSNTFRQNEVPWEPPIPDDELRQKNLARIIKSRIKVDSIGTSGSDFNGHVPRDRACETFLLNIPSRAKNIKLRLHFSSSEAVAKDFTLSVIRELGQS